MHAAKCLLLFICFVAVASGIKTIARDQGDLSLRSDTGVVDKDEGGASLQPVGEVCLPIGWCGSTRPQIANVDKATCAKRTIEAGYKHYAYEAGRSPPCFILDKAKYDCSIAKQHTKGYESPGGKRSVCDLTAVPVGEVCLPIGWCGSTRPQIANVDKATCAKRTIEAGYKHYAYEAGRSPPCFILDKAKYDCSIANQHTKGKGFEDKKGRLVCNTMTALPKKAAEAGSAAAMVQKQIKEAAKANAGTCDPMQHTSESTTAEVPKAGGEPVTVLADEATKSRQHIFFRAKSQGSDFEISLRENGNSFFTYNLADSIKNADVSNCRMVDKVSNEAGPKATTALMASEWDKVPSKFYWRGFRVVACTDSCSLNPLDTLAKEMTADKSKTVFTASPKLKEFIEKEMAAHPMTSDNGDEWVYIQSFSTDAKLSLALRPFESAEKFKVNFSYFLKHKCSS